MLLAAFGLYFILIMPYHLLGAHPFVAESFFNPLRNDQDTTKASETLLSVSESTRKDINTEENVLSNEQEAQTLSYDRSSAFVIDHSAQLGNAVFMASKPLKPTERTRRRIVRAVAVREYGTAKFSRVIRFMHLLPSGIDEELGKWVAVPKAGVDL